MLKSHVKFHSVEGKRLILIVDDEAANRALLGLIAEDEYEVLYAEDGAEALRLMRENAAYLSIVLLDLSMPEVNGFEVMEQARADEALSDIPIIVLTSELEAEVKSLQMGAVDFIPKPFNMPEVIKARIQKAIELHESRTIIQSTEREGKTGLFNKEYFYRYGEQFDGFHPDMPMDAVSIDINHFHLINELYGRRKGDEVLVHLADYLKNLRRETNCIVGRIEGDKFYIYTPANKIEYGIVSREINSHFDEFHDINVSVRTGIYQNVDKSIDIERRFDRAVLASNMIKGDYSRLVAYYDAKTHEKKLFEERLLAEVGDAVRQGQFYVNYQPKYNIKGDEPVLASAEALVRWNHPYLGVISPGVFIPLLEDNGLIHMIDRFVWEEVVRCLGDWKKEGVSVPVSINVSRMDLYNRNLREDIDGLLESHDLDRSDLYMEITESSYSDDVDQILEVVDNLHEAGFLIEMDDFGTGYSSLSMLAEAPIDVLKMDMRFIQNLNNDRQEAMIRMIMDIAAFMGLLVVAEGVETKEQVDFLKSTGCDIIQGFYFSKPLSAEDFEKRLRDEKER